MLSPIKSVYEEDMGDGFARVTVTYRWWYVPVAAFNYWWSLLFGRIK